MERGTGGGGGWSPANRTTRFNPSDGTGSGLLKSAGRAADGEILGLKQK